MRRFLFRFAALFFVLAISWAAPAAAQLQPSGEHIVGNSAIEPAYNAETGSLLYLLTPVKSPFPTHTSSNAVSPLYLVEYPPNTNFGVPFNCEGVPGNCPDHNGQVAGFATSTFPSVYGTNPNAVPGHDHLVDPPGGQDFNVAWEVIEVLFTPKAVANNAITHLTTEAAIDAAVANGYAQKFDLGFAFHCSVVSAAAYQRGTPVQ